MFFWDAGEDIGTALFILHNSVDILQLRHLLSGAVRQPHRRQTFY